MTNSESVRARNAEGLLDWLIEHPNGALPRMADIGPLLWHRTDAYGAWSAFAFLQRMGKIAWRSGTRSENRGHQAVRIIATGRVLKTHGCPFEPPA